MSSKSTTLNMKESAGSWRVMIVTVETDIPSTAMGTEYRDVCAAAARLWGDAALAAQIDGLPIGNQGGYDANARRFGSITLDWDEGINSSVNHVDEEGVDKTSDKNAVRGVASFQAALVHFLEEAGAPDFATDVQAL